MINMIKLQGRGTACIPDLHIITTLYLYKSKFRINKKIVQQGFKSVYRPGINNLGGKLFQLLIILLE